jgi:beta-galactosidase
MSFDDPYWNFPTITRNNYGQGTLTYEGTVLTDALQRAVVRDVLQRAGVASPDQDLPLAIRVRHGRNRQGKLLHYYFNFSGQMRSVSYRYGNGIDLLSQTAVRHGEILKLKPWDLAIIEE